MEVAGLMGGEIRDPERTLPRAAALGSAVATAFYICATAALLVLLPPEKMSEMQGLGQGGSVAAGILSAGWIPAVIALLVLATALGFFGGLGSAASRLPFAAGVDHLLPAAFGRIHPRWGTPHVSILSLGVVASFLLVAIQFGDTLRAAYETLISLMVISGFIPYLYVFGSAWKAGKPLSALSGWAVTVLAIACSIVPAADVYNVWLFETKLVVGTVAMVGSAWLVYRRSKE
jgi:APA family basic amino acid/polyamine antiporter